MGVLDRAQIDNGPLPATTGQLIDLIVRIVSGTMPPFTKLSAEDGVTAYYPQTNYANANITTVPAANTLLAMPFWSGGGGIVSDMAFSVAVVGASGSLSRVGIYDSDPVTFKPRTMLVDGGQIDTNASTGVKITTGLSVIMQPRQLYYLIFQCNAQPPTTSGQAGAGMFGLSASFSDQRGWSVAQSFGALPASWPGGSALFAGANSAPLVAVKFSSYTRP